MASAVLCCIGPSALDMEARLKEADIEIAILAWVLCLPLTVRAVCVCETV